LEWGEPERQQIHDLFKSRRSAIGRQGNKLLARLHSSFGYAEPQNLTPSAVAGAGENLIERLDLHKCVRLDFVKRIDAPNRRATSILKLEYDNG
jgi:hypothetical protein